jgi:hypothetical protein
MRAGWTSELADLAASGFLAPVFRASRWGANFSVSRIEGVWHPVARCLMTARTWGARNPDAAIKQENHLEQIPAGEVA